MLKVDICEELHDGKDMMKCEIQCDGDALQIVEDVGRVLVTVYSNIKRQAPFVADFFKYAMQTAVNDPEFWALEKETESGEGVSIFTMRDKRK